MSRVNDRMEYWQGIARTTLQPGTSLAEARAFFKTQGLELSCCMSGPDINNAYLAMERSVGRFFLIEYNVAVLVDVSSGQKIERVRVQRWGVGL